jgi:hypothetical protein
LGRGKKKPGAKALDLILGNAESLKTRSGLKSGAGTDWDREKANLQFYEIKEMEGRDLTALEHTQSCRAKPCAPALPAEKRPPSAASRCGN